MSTDDDLPSMINTDDALPAITITDDFPTRHIKVHRSQIKDDMLSIFSDMSIMTAQLDVVIIDCRGREEVGRGSGVVREIFTCFWNECYDSLMLGVSERVPYVRHDYDREKWQAIARILVKGYLECSYLPLKLSHIFLASCLFGENSFTENELIDSFKRYVSKSEAEVVSKCMAGTVSCEDDELMEFLSEYDCKRRVNKDNLPTIIKEIAHKELIQKPQYIADCWIPVLSIIQVTIPTTDVLRKIYDERKPTTAKVLSLLNSTPSNPAENEAFSNLKRFIRSLDDQKLSAFLSFTTATDVILTSKIDVTFTNLEGLQRRPVAHTCGCTLEVPSTYANFCEFREEFSNVLNVGTWQIDIV